MKQKVSEPQVLYDTKGRETHVILPIKKYRKLMEELEDALDLRAMREVEHEETIPWEVVKKKLSKRFKRVQS